MRTKAVAILCICVVAVALGTLLVQLGPLICLGALGAICLAGVILARPPLTTLLVLFLVYANLPVVASKFHGVPGFIAGSVLGLLLIPLVYHLIVRREPVVLDDTFRLLLLFFAVLIISSLLVAPDLSIAQRWITTFVTEGLLLYVIVTNVVRDRATLRRAVWALLLAGSFMSASCVYSEMTRSYHTDLGGLAQRTFAPDEQARSDAVERDRRHGTLSTSRRATGPIGEPNRFAQILLVLLPLALFRYRGERSLWLKLGAVVLGGTIFGGLLLTYSRSAFLVFAMLGVLLALAGQVRPREMAAAVCGVLVLMVFLAPGYLSRVESIGGVRALLGGGSSSEADGATRGRVTEMLAAASAFRDHPFLGVGPGQYEPFYSMNYQVNSEMAFRYIPRPRRAHNLYLELAAETGVVGLATFLTLVGLLVRRLWNLGRQLRERDPELANFALSFCFSLVAYLIMSVFLHLAYQRYFWLLIALSGAAAHLAGQAVTLQVENRGIRVDAEPLGLRPQN